MSTVSDAAAELMKQTIIENELFKSLCGLFAELCNVNQVSATKRKRENSIISLNSSNESVKTDSTTSTNESTKEPPIEPKVKKLKTTKEQEEIAEMRRDEVLACYLKVHDADYLFKTLSNELVCEYCLKPNDVIQCSGNCGGNFHAKCLHLMPDQKFYKAILMNKPLKKFIQPVADQKNCNECAKCSISNTKIIQYRDCSTCKTNNNNNNNNNNKTNPNNLMKCLLCPKNFHRLASCVPAGCYMISKHQLICDEHYKNSPHESIDGDKPLFGDIVWAKYRLYPWWPAVIVPLPRIPPPVLKSCSDPNQICVLFFGEHTYAWIWPTHIQLFDDYAPKSSKKPGLLKSIEEALEAKRIRNEVDAGDSKHFIRIRRCRLKSVGARRLRRALSVDVYEKCVDVCECNPYNPCSMNNHCYNWLTKCECKPSTCPAGDACQNRNFARGSKYRTIIKETEDRGFGMFAVNKIPQGSFIIEYVGEIIDKTELNQRFRSTEEFYFMNLDRDLYIDAGNYGNNARFINHSCEPNAEIEKWAVDGAYRIGIFACKDIMPGEEITIEYAWGRASTTKCLCGSSKCRGHL